MSTPAPTPMISLRQVRKVWNPDTPKAMTAVDKLSLDVAPGEFVVLLGPSGCGKSSLLYMVAGLEPASGGEMYCDGVAITGPAPDRGMIFQEASLYPWLTIADNVSFGLKLKGVSPPPPPSRRGRPRPRPGVRRAARSACCC